MIQHTELIIDQDVYETKFILNLEVEIGFQTKRLGQTSCQLLTQFQQRPIH